MPATSTLANFYKTAMVTGHATGDYVYAEMMDSIHITAKAIATGTDPDEAAAELVAEWRADASLAGSHDVATKYNTWAEFLEATL